MGSSLLYHIDYHIDVVFVVDSSGGMQPWMPQVEEFALRFLTALLDSGKETGKPISEVRARIVDFSDYAFEGDDAIHQTEFFHIPAEAEKFDMAFRGIDCEARGGDLPENGLEALYTAMNSDWCELKPGQRGRHIIVLISDGLPLDLQERAGMIGYPSDEMPECNAALETLWNFPLEYDLKLSTHMQRLLLFVPGGTDNSGHTWEWVADWPKTDIWEFQELIGISDEMIKRLVRIVMGAY